MFDRLLRKKKKIKKFDLVLVKIEKLERLVNGYSHFLNADRSVDDLKRRIYQIEEKLDIPHYLPPEAIGYTNLDNPAEDRFPKYLRLFWEMMQYGQTYV